MALTLDINLSVGRAGTGSGTSVFDSSLTFPTIQVFDTEAEFITQTDAPQYTIVHAKDTDKLYVWENPNWIYFNQN